jgi:hypothetical protein
MKPTYEFHFLVNPSQMIDLRIALESLITKLDFEIKFHGKDEDSFSAKYKKELETLLIETDFDNLKTIYKTK